MENNQTSTLAPQQPVQPALSERLHHSKALVALVAVLGVTVMALAAALVVNRSEAQSGTAGMASAPPMVSPAATTPAPVAAPLKVAAAPKTSQVTTAKRAPAPTAVASAKVCADCGTVESSTQVQRQGEVNGVAVGNTTVGLGTVAGGVLGGLLGHEVGGGSGKTAMTVLGAAGGAYAGNRIEKNMKKVTVYEVRVRMDDGSVRHLDISTPVAVGSKVVVEGKNLRLAQSAG